MLEENIIDDESSYDESVVYVHVPRSFAIRHGTNQWMQRGATMKRGARRVSKRVLFALQLERVLRTLKLMAGLDLAERKLAEIGRNTLS